ncbi:unnamed protein product [Candidula unifasciata]|uniref:Disease resistance R13L4/SHOC-2-like LRR domain-containing protein n=1 Tax=Candidula unifasciata TaxID=100452 RepID=A0A8S3YLX0_9EUPU|nr:unnamed protein product [Candidula unifasciata]
MGQPEALIVLPRDKDTNYLQTHDSVHKYDGAENEKLQTLLDVCSEGLTYLSLSDVKYRKVHITRVNLDYNKITQLPERLNEELPFLKYFTANGNELSSLPDDFGDLSNLEEIYLCENKLSSLPESLCKLSKLKVLKLNANCLRKLHSEIGQNISLETLSVDENKLKCFPATLGLLRNLCVLEANYNRLEYLPSTLNYLERLSVVDLSSNRLTSIPESFGDLKNLTHVDFSENKIGHLCQHFQSSKMLQRLFLDLNVFARCPEWFTDLESIVEIRMKCNELSGKALPEGFGFKSKHLKMLDMRGNFVQELPASFGHLLSLDLLLLGTPHNYLERKPHFLNGNWLSILPQSFTELTSLTKLFLEENQLRILPEDIGNLFHLEDLFLGSNMLVELPVSFTKLVALKRCQLSKNRLMSLPENFGELKLLTELHADFNKLRKLPESMKNLTNLELLDLSENKLKLFPSAIISSMIRLKTLYLHDNNFDDCDVPKIVRIHQAEQAKESSTNNWRGRSKKLELNQQSACPSEADQNAEICRTMCSDDSDMEEDWDQDISKLSSSSCSDIPQSQPDIEENWDIDSAFGSNHPDNGGQFDLDDEEPVRQIFIPSVVRLDSSGNSTSIIHMDIHRHCSAPYLYHAPMISRYLNEPGHVVAGQFDSDSSDVPGDEAHVQD